MSSSWWDFDLILNNSSCQFISIHQKPHSVLPPFENPTCSDKNPPFCLWSIIHLSTCIGIQILLNVGGLDLISFFIQEIFLPGSFYNLSVNFLQGVQFFFPLFAGAVFERQFFSNLLRGAVFSFFAGVSVGWWWMYYLHSASIHCCCDPLVDENSICFVHLSETSCCVW